MKKKTTETRKKLLFRFMWQVEPEYVSEVTEILEKMRETGIAEIIDIEVVEVTN